MKSKSTTNTTTDISSPVVNDAAEAFQTTFPDLNPPQPTFNLMGPTITHLHEMDYVYAAIQIMTNHPPESLKGKHEAYMKLKNDIIPTPDFRLSVDLVINLMQVPDNKKRGVKGAINTLEKHITRWK